MSIDAVRPDVYAMGDGSVAIFIGGGFRYLPVEVAEKFANDILAAVEKARVPA